MFPTRNTQTTQQSRERPTSVAAAVPKKQVVASQTAACRCTWAAMAGGRGQRHRQDIPPRDGVRSGSAPGSGHAARSGSTNRAEIKHHAEHDRQCAQEQANRPGGEGQRTNGGTCRPARLTAMAVSARAMIAASPGMAGAKRWIASTSPQSRVKTAR